MPGIGDTLREARLSRGLTHEYISQIIKIRPEFLEALEEENMAVLPGAFYAKNFLRRYADFLGQDSSALVDQFVAQENAAPSQPAQNLASPATDRPEYARRHWRPNFGLAVMLLLLLAASSVFAYSTFVVPREKEAEEQALAEPTPSSLAVASLPTATPTSIPTATSTPKPESTQAPAATPTEKKPKATATKAVAKATSTPKRVAAVKATSTPKPTATATPKPKATATPKPTRKPQPTNTPRPESPGEIVASVRTISPVAVTVTSDGRTVFQGPLQPGSTRIFFADANLEVYSGAAPNVLVSVNACEERTLDAYGCLGCQEAYFNFPVTYYNCR